MSNSIKQKRSFFIKIKEKKNITRRNFLKMSALGSALGGTALISAGCGSDPIEKLFPLHTPPYGYVSGDSIHFATTCQECSSACGLIIRTREGRAVKAEGNPFHPINEGHICLQGQSILQGLYSPARAVVPTIINEEKKAWYKLGTRKTTF